MAKDGKNGGFLTKMFKEAVELVTVGVFAAIAWQCFLDPIFMPIFHDATNPVASAYMAFMHETFAFIPQHLGLTPEPGLLSPLTDYLLGDRIAEKTAELASKTVVTAPAEIASVIPQIDMGF